jgi:hypothetical protein
MQNILKRRTTRLLTMCLLWIGLAAAARAQGLKADVTVGYSHLGANTFYANSGGLNGWQGAMNVKVKRFWGIEGDLAHYGVGAAATVPRPTTLLLGPRLTIGSAGLRAYVHGLVGGEHASSQSGFSGGAMVVGYGGGLDMRFAPYLSWRVSADYLLAPTESPTGAAHYRMGTGLVVRF